MTVSNGARRFRSRLIFLARIRRTDPVTVLTLAALALIFVGIVAADNRAGVASLVIGLMLMLLTPIGTALRILVRGR